MRELTGLGKEIGVGIVALELGELGIRVLSVKGCTLELSAEDRKKLEAAIRKGG